MSSERGELVRSDDEIRCASVAHRNTHPDRLATIARLHGIATPPVKRCSVLEIGCAVGGNLGAMAMSLPDARFVGVDLSERQIEQGTAALKAAGIGNVHLCALDLMDIGTSLGTFDYIVAHGVFSWISPDGQEELLALFARCLAPNGVAYVSYTTKPGGREASALRDAIIFDLRGIEGPRERLRRARDYLAFLRESIPDGGRHGKRFIEEVALMQSLDDQSLQHDYLGPFHVPVHFEKVVARAGRHGLWYLCDAEPALSADHALAPEAERARERAPHDLVLAEQHYDFLGNRRFRSTLLCRRGAPITRAIDPRLIDEMFVSSRGQPERPVEELDVHGTQPITFRTPESDLTTPHPATKAALLHLASVAPCSIPFGDLLEAVRARLGASFDEGRDGDDLRSSLVNGFLGSVAMVTLRTHAPPCVAQAGDRPVATAWSRQVALDAARVPSLDHDMVQLDDVVRRLLPLLDGTRDRSALEIELAAMVERGEVVVQTPNGRPGSPPPGAMDRVLLALARSALIVA